MASSTVEDYLKQILLLSPDSDALVPMGALATALDVVPGTATTMVKGLAADGLVEHQLRYGVRLTTAGKRVALGVLRRHRLIETFLVNTLKMDWTEVHTEAEQLEHSMSDAVMDRLDAFLGHPTADPHGDPIPTRQGRIDDTDYATLATCPLAKPQRIARVTEQSEEFLQFAEQNGLQPGVEVRVADRNAAAGLLNLRKPNGRTLVLSLSAADNILVAPAK